MKNNNATVSSKKLHNPKSHSPAVFIPCWLIQVPIKQITPGSKLLYGRLSQWSTEKGQVFRSAPQLSEELGVSVRQIERQIKELKQLNLIGTFQPQAGGLNHFEFYDHPWMHNEINKQLSYSVNEPAQAVPAKPIITTTPEITPPTKQEAKSQNPTSTASIMSKLLQIGNIMPPPDKNGVNPPTSTSVPPDICVGTPPTYTADINRKEIKINDVCVNSSFFQPSATHTQIDFLSQNPDCQTLFSEKFSQMEVTISELASSCVEHYDELKKVATVSRFKAWINRERLENYSKKEIVAKIERPVFAEEDMEIIGRYRQALKNRVVDIWFPDVAKREHARKLFESMNNMVKMTETRKNNLSGMA